MNKIELSEVELQSFVARKEMVEQKIDAVKTKIDEIKSDLKLLENFTMRMPCH